MINILRTLRKKIRRAERMGDYELGRYLHFEYWEVVMCLSDDEWRGLP